MNRPVRLAMTLIGAQLAVALSFGLSGIIGWHGTAQAEPGQPGVNTPGPSVVRSDAGNPSRVWVNMPFCEYEDGNVDGRPCLWVSPRTGDGYVNDGHNYRDDNG